MNTQISQSNIMNQKLAFDVLKAFPTEFQVGWDFGSSIKLVDPIDKIVVSGMGGSSFPAAICKTYLERYASSISFEIFRDYSIGTTLTEKTLVFVISYSGNTEEILSSVRDAMRFNSRIVVITTGGKLLSFAIENSIPYVKIIDVLPAGQESLSTGYFVGSLLRVLENSNLIKGARRDVMGMDAFLRRWRPERKAKNIAKKIAGNIPIIYTSSKYEESIARIVKIRFNQNSKSPAFYNVFSEMNHNELVGFRYKLANFLFLLIEDPDDDPRVKLRMKIFREKLCELIGFPSVSIRMIGENSLQKIISVLYFFEWVTLYLAELYDVDPLEADLVDELKYELDKSRKALRS